MTAEEIGRAILLAGERERYARRVEGAQEDLDHWRRKLAVADAELERLGERMTATNRLPRLHA